MELSYCVADPGGNTTVFVLTPVDAGLRSAVARELMERLRAEQAGFIHDGRMDMMGGEFCGNASRSFAIWQALHLEHAAGLQPLRKPLRQTVTVSGAPEPLHVLLEPCGEENCCRARIEMPLPKRIRPLYDAYFGACTLVEYPGICHLALDAHEPQDDDLPHARRLLEEQNASGDCFGLLYRQSRTVMRPLVYVRETDTLVWESSCASGSCAIAASEAGRLGQSLELTIHQPGGVLQTGAIWENGALTSLTLGGKVYFSEWGRIFL